MTLKLIKHVEKSRKRIIEERQIKYKKRKKKKDIITLRISLKFYQGSPHKERLYYHDLNAMRIFDIKIKKQIIKENQTATKKEKYNYTY